MDFTGLADHIVSSLTNEGYEVPVESIQSAIDSFTPSDNAGEAQEEEVHTCEKTVMGESGSYICGKKCKNQIDGMWFCGTEKSGHYKSVLTAAKKDPAKGKSKSKAKGKATPKAKAVVPSSKGKSKSSALVSNIMKSEEIYFHEAVPDSGLFIENTFRLLGDQNTREIYGVLADDNETILPVEGEALAFAEAHNLTIQEGALGEAKAKAAPKAKAPVAPKSKAAPKGKAPVAPKSKAAPKGKAPVAPKAKAPVAPKSKATPKGKAPVAPKAKAPVAPKSKVAPKAKTDTVAAKGKAPKAKAPVTAKSKSKIPPPTEEDENTLNELQAGIEDAVVEDKAPDVEEIVEDDGNAEVEMVDTEVDFGAEGEVEEEPNVEEEEDVAAEEDADQPDIEEEDEGEAIEDGEEGEGEEIEADE